MALQLAGKIKLVECRVLPSLNALKTWRKTSINRLATEPAGHAAKTEQRLAAASEHIFESSRRVAVQNRYETEWVSKFAAMFIAGKKLIVGKRVIAALCKWGCSRIAHFTVKTIRIKLIIGQQVPAV